MQRTSHRQPEDELEEAGRKFEESESILNLLRTQTATALSTPNDKEILTWYHQLNTKSCNTD